MSRRALFLGVTAVGAAGGYYLYQAGGDPKVAEKKAEYDASRLSSNIKSHIPGAEKEVKKGAESLGEQARAFGDKASAKFDNAVYDASNRIDQARKEANTKFDQARKDTGTNLNKAVDKFDKSVEDGAAKTKSTISSWFGGK